MRELRVWRLQCTTNLNGESQTLRKKATGFLAMQREIIYHEGHEVSRRVLLAKASFV